MTVIELIDSFIGCRVSNSAFVSLLLLLLQRVNRPTTLQILVCVRAYLLTCCRVVLPAVRIRPWWNDDVFVEQRMSAD